MTTISRYSEYKIGFYRFSMLAKLPVTILGKFSA